MCLWPVALDCVKITSSYLPYILYLYIIYDCAQLSSFPLDPSERLWNHKNQAYKIRNWNILEESMKKTSNGSYIDEASKISSVLTCISVSCQITMSRQEITELWENLAILDKKLDTLQMDIWSDK